MFRFFKSKKPPLIETDAWVLVNWFPSLDKDLCVHRVLSIDGQRLVQRGGAAMVALSDLTHVRDNIYKCVR